MMKIACLDISQLDLKDYDILYQRATKDRKAKAKRYLRNEDKIRCVCADALLRYAVRDALDLQEYHVGLNTDGKPYLVNEKGFHFNISHSGDWVVIAYGDSKVGIDVQQIKMDSAKASLALRFYTREEQDFVFLPDGTCDPRRFFQIWTAKESYLKYLGIGLRRSLDSFSVVPDGKHLGVRLSSTFSPDYCITLCTQEKNVITTTLNVEQLINQ